MHRKLEARNLQMTKQATRKPGGHQWTFHPLLFLTSRLPASIRLDSLSNFARDGGSGVSLSRMSPASPSDSPAPDRYEDFVRQLLQHEAQARGFLRPLLHSWDDVDDVLQEASLVAWRKFAQFEAGSSFRNWFLTIARFEALKHRRKQARSPVVLSEEVLDLIADEALEEIPALDRERHALELCLGQLPAPQRELLEASYRPGVKFHEIAAQTGKSAQALYKTIQRLRAALLGCIESRLKEAEA
jgi:RNA polymerase sigma-70 factor (ECF subfamily)